MIGKFVATIDNPVRWYLSFSNSEFPEYVRGYSCIHAWKAKC